MYCTLVVFVKYTYVDIRVLYCVVCTELCIMILRFFYTYPIPDDLYCEEGLQNNVTINVMLNYVIIITYTFTCRSLP